MAAPSRQSVTALEQHLFECGFAFDFFQAVRLLGRLLRDRKTVGGSARPSQEIVQFASWLSLAFPASAIQQIEKTDEPGSRARMTVTFLGLTGIKGVLPTYYTERALAQKSAKNDALANFLDIFNHRLVSLFYRAWQKHRPPVLYEQAALADGQPDIFTHSLFDLIGMGTAGLRGRMRVVDEALLPYAGLIAQRPRSATALTSVLRDYFAVPICIEQFLGSWYELNEADRCYLEPELERNQLGVGAFLGDRVWDQQAKFKIKVGPVEMKRFHEFLPKGEDMGATREMTRFFVGQAMAFDVQIILQASEVPRLCLGDEGLYGGRLGQSSWLKTSEFKADATDAVFTYLT